MNAIRLFAALTVLALPGPGRAADIPAPRDVLGFAPGEDFKLADWAQITAYFERLDAASERLTLVEVGPTTMGRRLIMAVITSEENGRRLEEIKAIQKRLHDPRGLGPAERQDVIRRGRAVVYFSCSIHSTEIAASQLSMEMAHGLASDESAAAKRIRDEVVLLLVPSVNPDGIDLVADWYRRNLGTPFEAGAMPWLYHPYAGHDNNRDWFMLTQKETRALTRVLYHEWFPLLVYDMHQMGSSGPRFFLPPYQDPINPNLDPLLLRELYVLVGQAAVDLTLAGKTGIATNTIFDAWYNTANRAAPLRHNAMSVLTEAASANIASPIFLRKSDLGGRGGGASPAAEVTASSLDPWPGGWWRLRDIMDYEKTTALSFLKTVSAGKERYLEAFARYADRQVDKGKGEPPSAYLVPPAQRDLPAAFELLDVLREGGAEIFRARAAFDADEVAYPAGTFVIPLAQPYRAFIKDLLERKAYPLPPGQDAAEHLPYDEASWSLPLQMGVRVVEVKRPFESDLAPVETVALPASELSGGGDVYLVPNAANNEAVLLNRLMKKGISLAYAAVPFESGGRSYPAGTVAVRTNALGRRALLDAIKGLGIEVRAASPGSAVKLRPLLKPRIALYQPWTASQDEGWLRWTLERHEFVFKVVHDAEIRAGNLTSSYSHLILPGIAAASLIQGRRPGDAPPEYAGGIGMEGVAAINAFVGEGGVLIAVDGAADFAIKQLGLPVRNIIEPPSRGPRSQERDAVAAKDRVYCPGSLLQVDINGTHPAGFGLGPEATVFSYFSPVFEFEKGAAAVIASYPSFDPLQTGILINGERIRGKAAAVECAVGKGRAVLLGFDPIHRGQARGSFKFLFNSLIYN